MKNTSEKMHNGVIEAITNQEEARDRHYAAPLLIEREMYIKHLLRRGTGLGYIRITASYMIRIVALMRLRELRIITETELEQAGALWSDPKCVYRIHYPVPEHCAAGPFMRVARGWFSFLGKLELPPAPWFEGMIQLFMRSLNTQELRLQTINRYGWNVRSFFRFLPEDVDIRSVSLSEIDAFIAAKTALGWKAQAIVSHCQTLKRFFRFAGVQGWCNPTFYLKIARPRLIVRKVEPRAPSWKETLQLVRSFKGDTAWERRAKAMVMLCTFYGIRSSEVTSLALGDIDWRNATFVIRRSKRGGVQQFPLLYNVGEAILDYLRKDRPRCSSRLVFISMRPPYGEVCKTCLWRAIAPRLREFGTRTVYVGPHSLRHGCATRLLQKGASLKEIADFLGHRSIRSVDIYARLDLRLLRKVAAFGLADLYETA